MAVVLSGAVYSALTYDQISGGDQIGLLLGRVVVDVKDTVSDTQISATKVDTSIHVFSHVPCPHSLRFYDKTGKIVGSNLKNLIKERQKEIVGWYRFRRHSSLRVSLRETAVHRSLLQTLGVPQSEHFVFLLTTASATTNLSTHSYDQVIYNLNSANEFSCMSLSVVNLGDTTHSQYKDHSAIITPTTGNGRYQSVVNRFENQFHDDTGGMREVTLIEELAANFISQLEKISFQVLEDEKQLEALEKDVQKYEQVAQQLNNGSKSALSPSSHIDNQNVGQQKEEANTHNEHGNRESVITDKERLITDFLTNSESEHKIKLEVHLTKSQRGSKSNGFFGGDDFTSSSSSSASTTDPSRILESSEECLLHRILADQGADLSVPLKPKAVHAAPGDTNKSATGPHLNTMTTTVIKSVTDTGPKKPTLAADHFSFVENVLKEAKEVPDSVNSEDSVPSENCVTVPMGAQLQSPPGVANMCSQMSAKNGTVSVSRNNSLPESANSSVTTSPASLTSSGSRRRTRSRPDPQQQQSASVTTTPKPSSTTRSYSPLSARNSSPSPTPESGTNSSPRHMRTRTPQSKSSAVTTTPTSSRESRIDSNRGGGTSNTPSSTKTDSLNKDVHKSPVRRCRPTRPKERSLSSSNSPSRRESNNLDYSSVRSERSVSPFF